MLVPIRCFTCGNVLADKWIPYITCIQEEKNLSTEEVNDNPGLRYINVTNPDKSLEGKILDELGSYTVRLNDKFISMGSEIVALNQIIGDTDGRAIGIFNTNKMKGYGEITPKPFGKEIFQGVNSLVSNISMMPMKILLVVGVLT